MISNLLVAFRAVFPVFVIIGIGMIVRRSGLISDTENRHINKMIFAVFFPMLMINNIYSIDISQSFDLRLALFGIISVFAVFFVTTFFVLRIEKDNKKRGALIQAIYRSNFVILGIPIISNIFGEGNVGEVSMMIAFIVPLFNVLAVIILEVFRGVKVSVAEIAKEVAKNPLVIGALIGVILALTKVRLPDMIVGVISQMGAVATPMALLVLGISFEFSQIRECGRNLWIAVIGRLIVVPAVVLTVGALMGFKGVAFVALIGIFATPSAVSSYTMAVSMDSDGVLAGNAVILSSLLSSVTMFLWIFIFKSLGIF